MLDDHCYCYCHHFYSRAELQLKIQKEKRKIDKVVFDRYEILVKTLIFVVQFNWFFQKIMGYFILQGTYSSDKICYVSARYLKQRFLFFFIFQKLIQQKKEVIENIIIYLIIVSLFTKWFLAFSCDGLQKSDYYLRTWQAPLGIGRLF